MAEWTLLYLATSEEKTFAEWGLTKLQRRLVSQDIDTVTFTADGIDYDDAGPFTPNESCIIKKDGMRWFYGRFTKVPRRGGPDSEALEYTLLGPWWYLSTMVFQQEWHVPSNPADPESGLVSTLKSRIILGQKLTGERMTTGEQITEALSYATGRGAPFAVGTIGPSITIPWSEVQDQTCAEIVRLMLRWTPDAVTWFDYSTTPYPTLHITRRGSASVLTLSGDESGATAPTVTAVDITPRHDLLVPGVAFKFEQTHQVDERSWTTVTVDAAGDPDTFGSLVHTIELGGGQASYQKQKIKTQSISKDSISWWKKKVVWLKDYEAGNLTITDATIVAASDILNLGGTLIESEGEELSTGLISHELLEGSLAKWMGSSIKVGTVSVKAKIAYNGASFPHFSAFEATVNLNATDVATGEYTRLTSYTPAEEIPAGLAAGFYGALSTLQYEGGVTLTEDECGGTARLGKVLCIANAKSEWETMNALIQEVAEDIDSGITSVRFGPASHLSPQDTVEMLRAQRGRRPSWRLQERQDGEASSSKAQIEGGTYHPRENTVSGFPKELFALQSSEESPKYIKLDTNDDGDATIQIFDTSSENYGQLIVKSDEAGFWFYDTGGNNIKYSKGKLEFWNEANYGLIQVDDEESSFWFTDGDGNFKYKAKVLDLWSEGGASVHMDLEDLNDKAVTFKEVDDCVDGVPKKRLVLASDAYDPE